MVARLLKMPMATDEMKQDAIAALPGFRGYFEKVAPLEDALKNRDKFVAPAPPAAGATPRP
jgi:hypothetical protein